MTTPITGAISLSDIRTELGLSGSISLGDTKVKNLLNQNTDLNSGHAAKYIGSSTTNVNLFSTMGSPGTATTYKAYIDSGVTIGGTSGSTALTVGQFPSGSSVIINNYGSIQGYGGSGGGYYSSGGAGGDAINANYANQSVTINNQSGATIYGGGGGGGSGGLGGSGGSGGAGGGGYYVNSGINFQYDPPYSGGGQYYICDFPVCCCGTNRAHSNWIWGGSYYLSTYNGVNTGEQECVDGHLFQVGTLQSGEFGSGYWSIGQYYNYNVYTSGGSGGSGGAGGNGGSGGQGQGYGQSNTSGSGGAGGSPGGGGSGGGTNAGAGGSGGYGGSGGTGGAGGTWGNAGSAGSTGNSGATGNTGASGNNGGGAGGSSGSGGGAGASGGAAGRYLVKGSNSVTLNNSGTVLGGLA